MQLGEQSRTKWKKISSARERVDVIINGNIRVGMKKVDIKWLPANTPLLQQEQQCKV